MIYIASDHGGFRLKSQIKAFLESQALAYEDVGAKVLDLKDDYVDFAKKVAKRIISSKQRTVHKQNIKNTAHIGILICRSGQGVCIAANRYKGVRAVTCWNEKSARAGRYDDHANVLCLPADYITSQSALKIVQAFLNTPFGKESRHHRRVKKLDSL